MGSGFVRETAYYRYDRLPEMKAIERGSPEMDTGLPKGKSEPRVLMEPPESRHRSGSSGTGPYSCNSYKVLFGTGLGCVDFAATPFRFLPEAGTI